MYNRQHHRCIYDTPEVPDENDLDKASEILENLSDLVGFVDKVKKPWYSIGEEDIMIVKQRGRDAVVLHGTAISQIIVNDMLRKLFIDLTFEEVDLVNKMDKYGKLKGWAYLLPAYKGG